MSEVVALNNAAVEVGRLTTPARDLEVMIQELEEKGFTREAQVRKARLAELNGGLTQIQLQIEKTLKWQQKKEPALCRGYCCRMITK